MEFMSITNRLNKTGSQSLLAAVFVTLGLLYCINFEDRSFWGENEAFYALGTQSVLEGNVLLPLIYNKEYANKPPLFFWWAAAVSLPLGGVSEWTIRLANILPALGILVGLYLFAMRWMNRWIGLLAVLLTGTSAEFWQQATQVRRICSWWRCWFSPGAPCLAFSPIGSPGVAGLFSGAASAWDY
jgi:4-amino-4-deoxy-L-arabinose transferase-like glycosyltransferase